MEDLTGRQLGPYRIIGQLGKGGMATVYKAYQPSVDRYVALKVLPRHYAAAPEFIERFKREAKVIASLEHPHILPIYDFGEADGYTFISMRLIDGNPLSDRLQGKPLPLEEVLSIISSLAETLDYAHMRGVIHRDIKPSNVLIDASGYCWLADFGIARILANSTQFTASGAFIGTPTYASPEQCLGEELDTRSDIYSLGVVLYELVTGRPPFDAEAPMAVVVKHIHDPLPLPRSINPALPEAIERVMLKALAKKPVDRFASAGEFAAALEAALRFPTPAAPKETGTQKAPGPKSKSPARRLWVAAAALLLLCLVLLLAASQFGKQLSLGYTSSPTASGTPTHSSATLSSLPLFTPAVPTNKPSETTALIIPTTERPVPPPTQQPGQVAEAFTGYGLPLSDPWGVVYAEQHLMGLFDGELVTLELVSEEGRFRSAGQILVNLVNSLTWDASRQAYWAVQGGPHLVDTEVNLLSPDGQVLATYLVSDAFDRYPRYIAWDGAFLWTTNDTGTLYKLQPNDSSQTLEIVDSYAPSIPYAIVDYASGLAWDGKSIWVLVADELARLDESGQPVCLIYLPTNVNGLNWYEWRGVAWDGEALWVSHASNWLYRIDPGACK